MKNLFFLFAMLFSLSIMGQTKIHPAQIRTAGGQESEVLTIVNGTPEFAPAAAGGLQSVESNASLNGLGTAASPLSLDETELDNNFSTDTERTAAIAASDAADGDKDDTNEHQDLSLSGTTIEISDGTNADIGGTFSTDAERTASISAITYFDKFATQSFTPAANATSVTLTGTPPTDTNYAAWTIVRGLIQKVGNGVTVSNNNKTFTFTRAFSAGETVEITYPIQ